MSLAFSCQPLFSTIPKRVRASTGIFALVTLIPTIIVYIERFHDRDKSGWSVLIGLMPIIGVLRNRFGIRLFVGTQLNHECPHPGLRP